jgi:membrane carboxypeptidase/penicillin-binding protein
LRPLSGEEFPVPEGITQVEIDPTTGLLATEHCLAREMEYFIKGTEPVIPCYGNSYEQMMSGAPWSIYSSPARPDRNAPPLQPKKKPPY